MQSAQQVSASNTACGVTWCLTVIVSYLSHWAVALHTACSLLVLPVLPALSQCTCTCTPQKEVAAAAAAAAVDVMSVCSTKPPKHMLTWIPARGIQEFEGPRRSCCGFLSVSRHTELSAVVHATVSPAAANMGSAGQKSSK
jgi:hypothetical protein